MAATGISAIIASTTGRSSAHLCLHGRREGGVLEHPVDPVAGGGSACRSPRSATTPFHLVPALRSKSHTGPIAMSPPGVQVKWTLEKKFESWLWNSSSTRYQSMKLSRSMCCSVAVLGIGEVLAVQTPSRSGRPRRRTSWRSRRLGSSGSLYGHRVSRAPTRSRGRPGRRNLDVDLEEEAAVRQVHPLGALLDLVGQQVEPLGDAVEHDVDEPGARRPGEAGRRREAHGEVGAQRACGRRSWRAAPTRRAARCRAGRRPWRA